MPVHHRAHLVIALGRDSRVQTVLSGAVAFDLYTKGLPGGDDFVAQMLLV